MTTSKPKLYAIKIAAHGVEWSSGPYEEDVLDSIRAILDKGTRGHIEFVPSSGKGPAIMLSHQQLRHSVILFIEHQEPKEESDE